MSSNNRPTSRQAVARAYQLLQASGNTTLHAVAAMGVLASVLKQRSSAADYVSAARQAVREINQLPNLTDEIQQARAILVGVVQRGTGNPEQRRRRVWVAVMVASVVMLAILLTMVTRRELTFIQLTRTANAQIAAQQTAITGATETATLWTATPTGTPTPTPTFTPTPTNTSTPTPSQTPSNTPTVTPSATVTNTPNATATSAEGTFVALQTAESRLSATPTPLDVNVEVESFDASMVFYTIAEANVRPCPRLTDACEIVAILPPGASLIVTGTAVGDEFQGTPDWYQVRLQAANGYVHTSLLTDQPPTATPTATNTVPSTPVPQVDSSGGGSTCDCSADTLNCSDFSTQSEAQACHDRCVATVGSDVHNLDGGENPNGVACESLP